MRNRLAFAGLIVLFIIVVCVINGPPLLEWATGNTYDMIPGNAGLARSLPPSLPHPMGTDDAGRDMLARVLQGGRISLMVGIISTFVSLIVGVSYGAIAGFMGGRIDNLMIRIVDIIYAIPYILIVIVLLSVFGGPSTPEWIKWLSTNIGGAGNQALSQIFLLFFAAGVGVVADDGARGAGTDTVAQESRVCVSGTCDRRFELWDNLSPPCPECSRPGDRLRDVDDTERDADRSVSVVLRAWRSAPYASWGSLADAGIKNLAIFPWQLIFPGLTMALTLFSLNFLGDGIRDALDPQTRKF